MKKSDVLDAIEIMDSKGWIQHHSYSSRGFCIMGACEKVIRYTNHRELDPILNMIREQYPERVWTEIFDWNDMPERTYEEVVMILEKTAATLDD